jgi:hypothetical protein
LLLLAFFIFLFLVSFFDPSCNRGDLLAFIALKMASICLLPVLLALMLNIGSTNYRQPPLKG